MKMGGWSSDSKMEQRSPRRCNARYKYSPWWGPTDPHHGLFSLKRLWPFETVAFPASEVVFEKHLLKGTQSWRMSEQMHPLSAESPTMSGFPGKKKRTKHRHIVSMFGPIMVRERRLELPRRLTHAPQTCLSTCSSTLAYLADALTPFKAVCVTRRATSEA